MYIDMLVWSGTLNLAAAGSTKTGFKWLCAQHPKYEFLKEFSCDREVFPLIPYLPSLF